MAFCYKRTVQVPTEYRVQQICDSNTGTETETLRVYYAFTSGIANVLSKLHIKITIVS